MSNDLSRTWVPWSGGLLCLATGLFASRRAICLAHRPDTDRSNSSTGVPWRRRLWTPISTQRGKPAIRPCAVACERRLPAISCSHTSVGCPASWLCWAALREGACGEIDWGCVRSGYRLPVPACCWVRPQNPRRCKAADLAVEALV